MFGPIVKTEHPFVENGKRAHTLAPCIPLTLLLQTCTHVMMTSVLFPPTQASLDTFMLHIASSQIRRVVKAFDKDPKAIFNSMDANNDGVLSLSELETGLSSLGEVLHDNPKDAARSLHEALTRAGDNDRIDVHTFERFVKQYMKNFMKDRVKRAMKTLFARRSARFTRMLNVARRRVTEAEGKRNHVRQILARTRAYVKKTLEFGPNVLMPDKHSATHKAMEALHLRLERAEQLIEKSVMHQQLGSDEISNACNFNSMRLNLVATSKLSLAQQCVAMSEKLSNEAMQVMGGTGLAQRTAQTLRNEVLKKDAEWRERRTAAIQTAMSRQRGEGRDRMTLDEVISAIKGTHSASQTLGTQIRKKRIAKTKRKSFVYDYNAPLKELWSTEALDREASVVDKSFSVDWARIRKKPSFQKVMTERCGRDINEIRKLKAVLKEHHQQLVSLFDHYRHNALSQGNQYFTMGVFFIFLKECGIIDKASLDRRQACVCFQLARPDRKGPAKLRRAIRKDALLRYNFLELIIHLALHKHGMLTDTPSEALKDFLECDAFAHGRDEVEVNGLIFRQMQLQDPKCISLLEKHKPTLMEIFAEFSYCKVNKRRKSNPGEEADDGAGEAGGEAQQEDGNPDNRNPAETGPATEESSLTPGKVRLDLDLVPHSHLTLLICQIVICACNRPCTCCMLMSLLMHVLYANLTAHARVLCKCQTSQVPHQLDQ